MIDEQTFNDWLQHPVTQAMKKICAGKRADLRNEWEMSDPTAFNDHSFALANAANIGWCRGLSFVETLDYEGYKTELDDEK